MEMHSYAKRRASKKWTIEQKRKLVEARIKFDNWFINKPANSIVPWKFILNEANLNDFNVYFVRKQWSNMIAKYKQYKQTRLADFPSSSHSEIVKNITRDWEFFEIIHKFVEQKKSELNSNKTMKRQAVSSNEMQQSPKVYAKYVNNANHQNNIQHVPLQYFKKINVKSEEKLVQECFKSSNVKTFMVKNPMAASSSSSSASAARHMEIGLVESFNDNLANVLNNFSSDEIDVKYVIRNTDHDFYSKPVPTTVCDKTNGANYAGLEMNDNIPYYQLNYFTDVCEDTPDFMIVETITQQQQQATQNSLPFSTTDSLHDGKTFEIKTEENTNNLDTLDNNGNILHSSAISNNGVGMVESSTTDLPSTSTERNATFSPSSQTRAEPTRLSQSTARSKYFSERDKYYRHKRHFNRRMEKRFDALLGVVGQIVKTEYPNICVSPLLSSVSNLVAGTTKLFSSDSEGESALSSDNDNDNNNKNKS